MKTIFSHDLAGYYDARKATSYGIFEEKHEHTHNLEDYNTKIDRGRVIKEMLQGWKNVLR